VRYNANNFLEKNKDPLNDSAVSVLKTATNQLTLDIFADYVISWLSWININLTLFSGHPGKAYCGVYEEGKS
jgi:myosin heavy subunit